MGVTMKFILLFLILQVFGENFSTNRKDIYESPDRKDKYENARNEGDEETKQKLEPNKMMHQMLFNEHMRRAEEAEQRQDYETAEQERKMAYIEEMKVQKLEEQIKKNEETANKNKNSRDLLKEKDGKETKGFEVPVTSVKENTSTSVNNVNESEKSIESSNAPSKDTNSYNQVTDFSDFREVYIPKQQELQKNPPLQFEANDLESPEQNKQNNNSLEYSYATSKSSTYGQSGSDFSKENLKLEFNAPQSRLISSLSKDDEMASFNFDDFNSNKSMRKAYFDKNTNPFAGFESKFAFDEHFFEDCSTQKKPLSERCKEFVKKCSDEIDKLIEWKKTKKKLRKPKLSEECSKWQKFNEKRNKLAKNPIKN